MAIQTPPRPFPPRQAQVLGVVRDYYRQARVVPSVRLVAREMGLRSPATAFQHLKALERKGYLRREGRRGFFPVLERMP